MSEFRSSPTKISLRVKIDATILKHPQWTTRKIAEYLGVSYEKAKGYIWNRRSVLKKQGLISEVHGRVQLAQHIAVHRVRLPSSVPPEWYDRIRAVALLPEIGRPKPVRTWTISRNRNLQLSFRSDYAKIDLWPTGKVSIYCSAGGNMTEEQLKDFMSDEMRLALFSGGVLSREEAEKFQPQLDYVAEHVTVAVPIETAPPTWQDNSLRDSHGISTRGDMTHPHELEYILSMPRWAKPLADEILRIHESLRVLSQSGQTDPQLNREVKEAMIYLAAQLKVLSGETKLTEEPKGEPEYRG